MSESSQQELEGRIREKAYALWEADGRPEGRSEEYWERARRLIEGDEEPEGPDMVKDPPL